MQWTNEEVVRLIGEFRERRALWDNSAEEFRAHAIKAEAWTALARSFGCEVAELRKKMNSLFASHRRERLRVRAGGRSKWFAYSHFSFLRTHLEASAACAATPAPPSPGVRYEMEGHYAEEGASDEEQSDDDNESSLRLHHEVIVKDEPPDPPYLASPSSRRRGPPARRPRQLRCHNTATEASPALDRNLVRTIRSVTRAELRRGSGRGRDECDVFGEYIANALRKHDERTRAMIKHAIGNILFEQEMKQYVVATAPPRAAAPDRNPLLLDADHERAPARPDYGL